MKKRMMNVLLVSMVSGMFACGGDEPKEEVVQEAPKKEAPNVPVEEWGPVAPLGTPPLAEPKPVAHPLEAKLAAHDQSMCGVFTLIGMIERRNGEIAYAKFPHNAFDMNTHHQSLNRKSMQAMAESYGLTMEDIHEINKWGLDNCEW